MLWQTGDKIFLVLEYCDGGDLAAYIHRHGKVSEEVARHFMRQLGTKFFIFIVSMTMFRLLVFTSEPH